MSGRGLLHTGSKQPAMPATKAQPSHDPVEEHEFEHALPSEPSREKEESKGKAKHGPRRRPGITDVDEFMRIQKAWENKLPLDEDPNIPEHAVRRPVQSHTSAMLRKVSSNEMLIRMQRKYDYSYDGIRRYVERNSRQLALEKQRFISMRHGVLGPDLATAHFITHRGGRVKFVGHSEWFTDDEPLPKKFDENYLVEKVDATSKCLHDCLLKQNSDIPVTCECSIPTRTSTHRY